MPLVKRDSMIANMEESWMLREQQKNDKLIGSLAVLKSDLIESDFISSYIPMVATVLIEVGQQEEEVKVDAICKRFEDMYGFTIDHAPMVTILNRCVKKKLVERRKNAVYIVNLENCREYSISDRRIEAEKERYRIVVEKLAEYYNENFSFPMSNEQAGNHLIAFLNENSTKIITVNFPINEDDLHTSKQHFYIISLFIKKCYEEDRQTFTLIQDLATAYLVASALAYTEYDEQTQLDAFKNLVIYIDTPLLIRILGLNGKELQDAALALLQQLKKLNAVCRIFAHTYDELEIILSDCKRWIEDARYDEFHASMALRNFVERKFTKADIQEYIDTLEEKLNYYEIGIDNEDYYAGRYYKRQVKEKVIEVRRKTAKSKWIGCAVLWYNLGKNRIDRANMSNACK